MADQFVPSVGPVLPASIPGAGLFGQIVNFGIPQVIPDSVPTTVLMTVGSSSGVTATPLTGRLTIVTSGTYKVTWGGQWDSVVAGFDKELRLHKNGAVIWAQAFQETDVGSWVEKTAVLDLLTGDIITAVAFQNSGINVDLSIAQLLVNSI